MAMTLYGGWLILKLKRTEEHDGPEMAESGKRDRLRDVRMKPISSRSAEVPLTCGRLWLRYSSIQPASYR